MSVSALAQSLGVRRATLSAYLNGRSQLTFAMAAAIAGELGLSVAELTHRVETVPQPDQTDDVRAVHRVGA